MKMPSSSRWHEGNGPLDGLSNAMRSQRTDTGDDHQIGILPSLVRRHNRSSISPKVMTRLSAK